MTVFFCGEEKKHCQLEIQHLAFKKKKHVVSSKTNI